MSKTSEVFRFIADEIEQHPDHWTQGTFARDRDGNAVHPPRNPEATCWCIRGLVLRDLGKARWFHSAGIVDQAIHEISQDWSMFDSLYNDAPGRKPEDIVAVFRLAADIARKEGC